MKRWPCTRRVIGPTVFILTILALTTDEAYSQTETPATQYFHGAFLGVNVGSQNLFAGALINNIDVLAQETRRVIEFAGGVRHVFGGHLLVGVQLQFGLTDGDLTHFDTPSSSNVSYANDTQTGYGLTLGYAGGPRGRFAVYAYAFATDRSSDIGIVDPVNSYSQMDGQSFLQYGITVEYEVVGAWHLSGSFGSQVVDYGDLVTNIELAKKPDVRVGVVYQL